jgi:glycosyltransferase involved in cell wall biosynthesis
MIRVTANLSWMIPGAVGGSEEYTVRLLRAAMEHGSPDVELRVVGSAALRDAHPDLAALPFDALAGPMNRRAVRIAAESTRVHALTRTADIVHHFGGRIPARHHGNDIVTIHDLQPLHLPDNFSSVKRRYLAWALPRTAEAAQLICTPSQWVADTVVAAFDVDPRSVRPVSSTYDTDEEVDSALVDSLGSGPIVLYPAVTHPHKNHGVLLDAVDRLVADHPGLVLVLTGAAGRADEAVAARIARSRAEVVRPGRVSSSVLRGLLRQADVLAFPSSYEGFGLPVLEAMRVETPVVAADATALPEVVGDAAVLVNPDDPDAWASAIDEVLIEPATRERLNEAGQRRVEHYAPGAAAARLLDVWRSAV